MAYMLVLDIDYRSQRVAHALQVRDLHSMVGPLVCMYPKNPNPNPNPSPNCAELELCLHRDPEPRPIEVSTRMGPWLVMVIDIQH